MKMTRSARFGTLIVVACAAPAGEILTRDSVGLVAWSWFLTVLQLGGIWSLSRDRPWGWLIGSTVQSCWAMYGALTSQLAFVFGCCISLAIQGRAWLRWTRRDEEQEGSR
ncbi:MAG: hypothetical protein GY788_16305 [bacterium]|nr:hypothetical protein [bacterium]